MGGAWALAEQGKEWLLVGCGARDNVIATDIKSDLKSCSTITLNIILLSHSIIISLPTPSSLACPLPATLSSLACPLLRYYYYYYYSLYAVIHAWKPLVTCTVGLKVRCTCVRVCDWWPVLFWMWSCVHAPRDMVAERHGHGHTRVSLLVPFWQVIRAYREYDS